MIHLSDKSNCCGCGACSEICPKHCIQMHKDRYGFNYPVVDTGACVECNLCNSVCPIENSSKVANSPHMAYASWGVSSPNNTRSTSGALAYEFSRHIVLNNGVVYGAALCGQSVRHIRVCTIEDIELLRGSKYVQSDMHGIFSSIKQDIKLGLKVLFIGTPCQVAAVKRFVGKADSKLFLVDIICHGVPSQQMLDEHIESVTKGKAVSSLSFRDGESYTLRINGDGINYCKSFLKDAYLGAFLNSCTMRDSCYYCHFSNLNRPSDITIGDFWGVKGIDNPDNRRVSLVLPNTEKGKQFFNSISDSIVSIERPLSEAVAGNYHLHSNKGHSKHKIAFRALSRVFSFETAARLSVLDRYVVKVVSKIRSLIVHR